MPLNHYIEIGKKEKKIKEDFEKVLNKYIKAYRKNDENILREFKYSTFQYYHNELGLIDIQQVKEEQVLFEVAATYQLC